MRRLWPFTVRGTGALILAVGCLIAANELGLVELLYFGVLLIAVLVAAVLSLFLTRRTGAIDRTMIPESVGVGDTAVVTARVTVRTAVPTPPGTWETPSRADSEAQPPAPSPHSPPGCADRSAPSSGRTPSPASPAAYTTSAPSPSRRRTRSASPAAAPFAASAPR